MAANPFSFDDSNASNNDDETPIRGRRQRGKQRSTSLPLVLGGVFVLLLLVGGGISLAWWKFGKTSGGPISEIVGQSGLSESREGEEWTHAELRKHLNKKGIKWDNEVGIPGGTDRGMVHGPLLIIMFDDPNLINARFIIRIERASNRDAAKELAGVIRDSLCWGRFVFSQGPATFQDEVEQAKQKLAAISLALR